jgi:hypothetical protein
MEGRSVSGSSFSIADDQGEYNGNGRKIAVFAAFAVTTDMDELDNVRR